MRASTGSTHSRSSVASLHDLIHEINASLSGASSAGPSLSGSTAPNTDILQHSQPASSNGRSSGTWRATSELGYYYSDTGDSTGSAQPPAPGIKIQQQPPRSSTSSDGIGQYSQQQGAGWEIDGSLNRSYNGGMVGGGLRRSSIGSYTADSPPPVSEQEAEAQGEDTAVAAADMQEQQVEADASRSALLSLPSANSRRSASVPRLTAIAEETSSCASTPSAATAMNSAGGGTSSAAPSRLQSGGNTAGNSAPSSSIQQAAASAAGTDLGLANIAEPHTAAVLYSRRSASSSGAGDTGEAGALPANSTSPKCLSGSLPSSDSSGSTHARHKTAPVKQALTQQTSHNSSSGYFVSGGYPPTSTNPSQAGSASHVILSNGQLVLASTDLLVSASPTTADMTAHLHDADPVDSWVTSQAAALLPAPAWDKQRQRQQHRQLQTTASISYADAAVDSPMYAWSSGLSTLSQQQQQQMQEPVAAEADPGLQQQELLQDYVDETQLDADAVAVDPGQVATVTSAAAAPATLLKTNSPATPATSVISIASSSKPRSSLSSWLGSKPPSHNGGSEAEQSVGDWQQQQQQVPGRRRAGNLAVLATRQSSGSRRNSLMRENTSSSFHLQNGLAGWGVPPETPAFAGRTKRHSIPWDAQPASLDAVGTSQKQQQLWHGRQQDSLQLEQLRPQPEDDESPEDEWEEQSADISQQQQYQTMETQQDPPILDQDEQLLQQPQQGQSVDISQQQQYQTTHTQQDQLILSPQEELLQQTQQDQQQQQQSSIPFCDNIGHQAAAAAVQQQKNNQHHALLSALNPLEFALWQQRQHQRMLLDRALHALTSLQADVDTLLAANQSAAVQAAAAIQYRDLVQELQQQLLSVQQQQGVTKTLVNSKSGYGNPTAAVLAADGSVSSTEPWTIKADWPHQNSLVPSQVHQYKTTPSAVAGAGVDGAVDDFEAELLRLEAAAPGRRLSEETLRMYYASHGMTDAGQDVVSQQQQQQQQQEAQLPADVLLAEVQQQLMKEGSAGAAAEAHEHIGQPAPQQQRQQRASVVGDGIDDFEAQLLALEAAAPGRRLSAETAAAQAAEPAEVTAFVANSSNSSNHKDSNAATQQEQQQDLQLDADRPKHAAAASTATAAVQDTVVDDFEAILLAAEAAEPTRRLSAGAVADHGPDSSNGQQQQWAEECVNADQSTTISATGLPDGPNAAPRTVTFQLPNSQAMIAGSSDSKQIGAAASVSGFDDFERELMALEASAAAAAGVPLEHTNNDGSSSSSNDGRMPGLTVGQSTGSSATDAGAAHGQQVATAGTEQKLQQQSSTTGSAAATVASNDGIGMFAGSSSCPTHGDSHGNAGTNITTATAAAERGAAATAADSIAIGTLGSLSQSGFGRSSSSPSNNVDDGGRGAGHRSNVQQEGPAGSDSDSDDFEAMMRANEAAAKAAAGRSTTAAGDMLWEEEAGGDYIEQLGGGPPANAQILQHEADTSQQPQQQQQQESAHTPEPQPEEHQQLLPGSISFDSAAAALAPAQAPVTTSSSGSEGNPIDLALDFGHVGSVGGDVAGLPLSPRTAATSGIREFDWLADTAAAAAGAASAASGDAAGPAMSHTVDNAVAHEQQQQVVKVEGQLQQSQQQVDQQNALVAESRQPSGSNEEAAHVTALGASLSSSSSRDGMGSLAVTDAMACAQDETASEVGASRPAAVPGAASAGNTGGSTLGTVDCSARVESPSGRSSKCSDYRECTRSGISASGDGSGGSSSTGDAPTASLMLDHKQQQQSLSAEAYTADDANQAAAAAVTASAFATVSAHGREQEQQDTKLNSTGNIVTASSSGVAATVAALPHADTGRLAVWQQHSQELVGHTTSTWPAGPAADSNLQLQQQQQVVNYCQSVCGNSTKPHVGWNLDCMPSARPATAPGQLGCNKPCAAIGITVGSSTPPAAATATEFSQISLQALEEVTRSASAAATAARAAVAQAARLSSVGGSCVSLPASRSDQSLAGVSTLVGAAVSTVPDNSCDGDASPHRAPPAAAAGAVVWPAASFREGSPSSSMTGRGSDISYTCRPPSLLGSSALGPHTETSQQAHNRHVGKSGAPEDTQYSSSAASSGSGHIHPSDDGQARNDSCHTNHSNQASEPVQQHKQQQHTDEPAWFRSIASQAAWPVSSSTNAVDADKHSLQPATRPKHDSSVTDQPDRVQQTWQHDDLVSSVAAGRGSTSSSRPSTAPAASSSAGTAANRPLSQHGQQRHQARHQVQHQQHHQLQEQAHHCSMIPDLSVAGELSLSENDSSSSNSSSSVVSGIDDLSDLDSSPVSEEPLPHHTAWLAADADLMSLQSQPTTSDRLDSKRHRVSAKTAEAQHTLSHTPSSQPRQQQSPSIVVNETSASSKLLDSKYVTRQLRMIDRKLESLERLADRDMHEQQCLREDLQQQRKLWQQQLQLAEQQLRDEACSEDEQTALQQQWELDRQRAALFGAQGMSAAPVPRDAGAAGFCHIHLQSPAVSRRCAQWPSSTRHTSEHVSQQTWHGREDLNYLLHMDQQPAGCTANVPATLHCSTWTRPAKPTAAHQALSSYAARGAAADRIRPHSSGSVTGLWHVSSTARQFGNYSSTAQILKLDHSGQQPGRLYGQPIEHWVLPPKPTVGTSEYPSTYALRPPATPEQHVPPVAAAPKIAGLLNSPAGVSSCGQVASQQRPFTADACQSTRTSLQSALYIPSRLLAAGHADAGKASAISNSSSGWRCGNHQSGLWREVALECELEAVEQALLRSEVAGVAAETKVVAAALRGSWDLLL